LGASSIETFLIQFDVCAAYNKWGKRDKRAQLKCCLSGPAAQILWDDGPDESTSYEDLVPKLKTRFGAVGLHECFSAELRARRRKNNESIAELHSDIKRLMTLAFPDSAHSKLGQVIARDHFIAALGDRELEYKVKERDPETLEDAFKAAIRVETPKNLSNRS
jgi:hypothetical protein